MVGEPLYQRVKRDIAAQIADGTWQAGSLIPSEPELQQRYRVSRTTVRRAVDELVAEGLLTILRGVGTRVAERHGPQPTGLISFSQLAQAKGVQPGRRWEELHTIAAPAEVADELGITEGAGVVRFARVRTADGEPASLGTSYLPRELFHGGEPEALLRGDSLYAQLEDGFGLVVHSTRDTFGLARADATAATRLGVTLGEPLLLIRRHAYDKAGRPLEYCRILVRPDRYHHVVTQFRKR